MAHASLGWPEGDKGRLAADWFRTSTTPAIARATLQAAYAIDVTADAARVRCPALVLHRVDATVIPLDLSAELARALPAGRLEMLPGASASLFFEGGEQVVDRLIQFVHDPAAGHPVMATALNRRPARGSGALSPREIEVLRLVANGESNGQIAARLGISINTVERHVVNLYRKIDPRARRCDGLGDPQRGRLRADITGFRDASLSTAASGLQCAYRETVSGSTDGAPARRRSPVSEKRAWSGNPNRQGDPNDERDRGHGTRRYPET